MELIFIILLLLIIIAVKVFLMFSPLDVDVIKSKEAEKLDMDMDVIKSMESISKLITVNYIPIQKSIKNISKLINQMLELQRNIVDEHSDTMTEEMIELLGNITASIQSLNIEEITEIMEEITEIMEEINETTKTREEINDLVNMIELVKEKKKLEEMKKKFPKMRNVIKTSENRVKEIITKEKKLEKLIKETQEKTYKEAEIFAKTYKDKFIKIINKYFPCLPCSKCGDIIFSMTQMNSVGTGIKLCCNSCGNKHWIMAENYEDEDRKTVRDLMDKIDYFNKHPNINISISISSKTDNKLIKSDI